MKKFLCGMVAFAASLGLGSAVASQAAPVMLAPLASLASAQYGGDWRPGSGWDQDIEVRCASADYRYNLCQVDTGRGGGVRIQRQISKTRCVEGSNWGWNRAGVWVDQGCEAVFRVQRRWADAGPGPGPGPGPGGPWRPGPDWNQAIVVRCASGNYQYNMCQVDTGRGSAVRVQRQISKTRCIEGRNWGWNRAGVWVDGGCEAEFRIDRRWR
jgi:hypothetical protein